MSRVLIVLAHPRIENSPVTRALVAPAAQAGRGDPSATPPLIEVRDLYALYPDYLIDVAAEQAALAGSRCWCGCD